MEIFKKIARYVPKISQAQKRKEGCIQHFQTWDNIYLTYRNYMESQCLITRRFWPSEASFHFIAWIYAMYWESLEKNFLFWKTKISSYLSQVS